MQRLPEYLKKFCMLSPGPGEAGQGDQARAAAGAGADQGRPQERRTEEGPLSGRDPGRRPELRPPRRPDQVAPPSGGGPP